MQLARAHLAARGEQCVVGADLLHAESAPEARSNLARVLGHNGLPIWANQHRLDRVTKST